MQESLVAQKPSEFRMRTAYTSIVASSFRQLDVSVFLVQGLRVPGTGKAELRCSPALLNSHEAETAMLKSVDSR